MAYIPAGAEWYLATLIQQITVEGDNRNVVHKNLVLVRADCPEEAYELAHKLGKESEVSYENPEGRRVQIRFRGLSELTVIYDELQHGAEISYGEMVDVPEDQIEALLRRKEDLALFRPVTPTEGPDYSSKGVLDQAAALEGDPPAGPAGAER